MKILVTNDDGVFAPGIAYLSKALEEAGYEVVVFAPHIENSGKSHAITLREPMLIKEEKIEGLRAKVYSVTGTPADCVRIAHQVCKDKIDLVFSGCNLGYNAGMDILYSGTVSAAIEANLFGVSGLALSAKSVNAKAYFETAVKFGLEVLKEEEDFLKDNVSVLNINVPFLPTSEIKGKKYCKVAKDALDDYEMIQKDNCISLELKGRAKKDLEEDTDRAYLEKGYVTITPLIHDLTNKKLIKDLQDK